MKKEYKNKLGKLHRTNGPAVEFNSGTKHWFINGKFHREDGPAVESINGDRWWYLNNIGYTEDQYHQELIKLKLKRLVQL
jgi:hypothetical protein